MKRLLSAFFRRLPIRKHPADEHLHLLNNTEVSFLRRLENKALLLAAIIGTNGVLLLYLPQYCFPHWFLLRHIQLLSFSFDISLVALIYGMVLSFLEVYLLYLLNLYCAHEIAIVTGFLDVQTKQETSRTDLLVNISCEKKDREVHRLGINPFQGLSKQAIWLITVLVSLKAALSNLIVRVVLSRILGRYAVREVLDLAGIPIFAFWNVIAIKLVLRETRVVIMGQNLIDRFITQLPINPTLSDTDKDLIYDTLQYIAVSKRDYHRNHYYLTIKILDHFKIPAQERHLLPKNFFDKLQNAPIALGNICRLLILIGFLLDGSLSYREERRLIVLNRKKILSETYSHMRRFTSSFLHGKGIDSLILRYLSN